jgi:hypothetical protein
MTIMGTDRGDKSSWFGRDLGESGWRRRRGRAFWRTDRALAPVEEHYGCEITRRLISMITPPAQSATEEKR